jgi:RNA polymerase sigma-70 factor, ECF subfamily
MTSHAGTPPEQLLSQARGGDVEALGRLLDSYRNYLKLLARTLSGNGPRDRLDHSDLVQEVFLAAHRGFARFRGGSEPELVAWLRRILARRLFNQIKKDQTVGQDIRRQVSLDAMLEQSNQALQRALAVPGSTPDAREARREQAVRLADAVAELPPDSMEVFTLRTLDELPWKEVAARMGRSEGAVKMLWSRTMFRLHAMLRERP